MTRFDRFLVISETKIMYKRGLRTPPCGTLLQVYLASLFTSVYTYRSDVIKLMNFTSTCGHPIFASLSSRIFMLTLSNAPLTSRKATNTSLFSRKAI